MQTGIKAIDAMIPIGRGQRELIIGDRQTGKTAIAIDAIINQKETASSASTSRSGRRTRRSPRFVQTLEKHGAMEHTIIVAASASDPAPLQYIAPYAGLRDGRVLHVQRQARPLHLRRPVEAGGVLPRDLAPPPAAAGPRSLPGDVFYLHSRLLERASKLNARREADR